MAKIYWKARPAFVTVRIPKIQVTPSRGHRRSDAFMARLEKHSKYVSSYASKFRRKCLSTEIVKTFDLSDT